MKVQYLKTMKILNCDKDKRRIIRFKRLHIPFTNREINKFISAKNRILAKENKTVSVDLSERK